MPPCLPLFLVRSEGTSGLRGTCSLAAQTVRTHKAGTSVTPLPSCDCSHPLVSYPLPDLGALQHCLHTDTICSGFGPRAGTAALLGDPEINQNYLDSFITPCSHGYYGIIWLKFKLFRLSLIIPHWWQSNFSCPKSRLSLLKSNIPVQTTMNTAQS